MVVNVKLFSTCFCSDGSYLLSGALQSSFMSSISCVRKKLQKFFKKIENTLDISGFIQALFCVCS